MSKNPKKPLNEDFTRKSVHEKPKPSGSTPTTKETQKPTQNQSNQQPNNQSSSDN